MSLADRLGRRLSCPGQTLSITNPEWEPCLSGEGSGRPSLSLFQNVLMFQARCTQITPSRLKPTDS